MTEELINAGNEPGKNTYSQTVLDLGALHEELERRLKDLDIYVLLAPDAYDDMDGEGGIVQHPTFFEDAVVLIACYIPPHAVDAYRSRWIIKVGEPVRRFFRITVGGMLSEVYYDGRVDNILLVNSADDIEGFIRSVPPVQLHASADEAPDATKGCTTPRTTDGTEKLRGTP